MPTPPKIRLAQLNFTVGDLPGNTQKILQTIARHPKTDLLIFPELALTGYPPEDLLLSPSLAPRIDRALQTLSKAIGPRWLILGTPRHHNGKRYNAALVLHAGQIIAEYHKRQLPNYGVFDEKRYFTRGQTPLTIDIKGTRFGLTICEDLWHPAPARDTAEQGADFILNLNASPYDHQKHPARLKIARARARETGLPLIYAHGIGGQDDLIFDGGSFALNATGDLAMQAPHFIESHPKLHLEKPPTGPLQIQGEITPPFGTPPDKGKDRSPPDKGGSGGWSGGGLGGSQPPQSLSPTAHTYAALVLALRDYLHKNGFQGALLGLSGGIDSALTLAIATDALGPAQVQAIMLPSRHTSALSRQLAADQATQLGTHYQIIDIDPTVAALTKALKPPFQTLPPDQTAAAKTAENLQARARGTLLMALANRTGHLLLATGNKSELAVGYATLYGDMAGGFAPLKDLSKTQVYKLAHHRNAPTFHLGDLSLAPPKIPAIPQPIIDRPPSAELAPNQKDTDSLPPYDILDPILERYIEQNQTPQQITAAGFPSDTVEKILRLVDQNEHKRRQAPPGPRVTPKPLTRDRRYPITNAWK